MPLPDPSDLAARDPLPVVVALVVLLGPPEGSRGDDLGDVLAPVLSRGVERLLRGDCGPVLLLVVIEGRRAVPAAEVQALVVRRRGVVDSRGAVQQPAVGHLA